MRNWNLAAALLLAAASPAAAMDVGTFLAKAEAAQKKGILAVFSSDARLLMSEIKNATQALKAERLAAAASGAQRSYCPRGKASLSQEELLAAMRSVPMSRRSQVSVKDALRSAFSRKFPCPK